MACSFQKTYSPDIEQLLRPYDQSLSEQDRRRFAALEAITRGHGGIRDIAKVLAGDPQTVQDGRREIQKLPDDPAGSRVRKPDGGRNKTEGTQADLIPPVQDTLQDRLAGDPMRQDVVWTAVPPQEMSTSLREHAVCAGPRLVRRMLDGLGVARRQRLQVWPGGDSPPRDAPCRQLAHLIPAFLAAGNPVLRMDTHKKAYVGRLDRDGQVSCQQARKAFDHDFPSLARGVIMPPGIDDLARHQGWIHVGRSRDTTACACDRLRVFGHRDGQRLYPNASAILLVCDGGGRTSCHKHLFKEDLQALVHDLEVPIRVAHDPAYGATFNPLERRLFSHVTRACQGVLLASLHPVRGLIHKTKTPQGLSGTVRVLDTRDEGGRTVSEAFKTHMPIVFDTVLPTWHYWAMPQCMQIGKLFCRRSSDMAEKSKQQVTPEGRAETIDFSRYIKDWSVKYGFSAQQATEEIDKWIAEIEATQNDLYKLGLAAFAKKNFGEASKLFNESAEYNAKKLEDLREKERGLAEKVVRDFRLSGDAHYSNYIFDQALIAYERALTYVSRQQTPQLWAATLSDVGRVNWELGIRAERLAIEQYLSAAVKAYHQALEVYTREQLPLDWAMTQNNLGSALRNQGIRTGGEAGTHLLAEAVTAYRQALEVRTLNTLPPQWAQTQNNLAQAYTHLEDWANAAESYSNVLAVYPDDKEAYGPASYLYHEMLFEFPRAFMLNQRGLERNPADLAGLSDFAEKHFTTGRFSECDQRIALLLANPAVAPSIQIALGAIQIANSLALGNTELVSGRIDAILESITDQSEGFKVGWSFKGTRYFINNTDTLAPYRPWLMQLFDAVGGEDRHAVLSALQEVRVSFPLEVKR